MALVEAEHQQITHWLKSRFPGGLACPLCRGDQWETDKVNGLIASSSAIFIASCKHCGHILLFSPELIKAPIPEPPIISANGLVTPPGLVTPASVRRLAKTRPLKAATNLDKGSPPGGSVTGSSL
jgi:hypothetical protein